MKFPSRKDTKIDDDILESETGICDCGHPDYIHKQVDEKLRDPNDKWSKAGECVLCMCPRFSLQHSMTHKEYLRVRDGKQKVGDVA